MQVNSYLLRNPNCYSPVEIMMGLTLKTKKATGINLKLSGNMWPQE
jgi:hypothetical protein